MFCPECRDEFRPGFTRCARCDLDLVPELAAPARPGAPSVERARPVRLADYCGFFTLEEALAARDELRAASIASEVVIRAGADPSPDAPGPDEHWLRVDVEKLGAVEVLLGEAAANDEPASSNSETAAADGDDFECSACGARVPQSASRCPGCGIEFDED